MRVSRRILAMDPGKVNFAWVLWDQGRIQDSGWVTPIAAVNDDATFVNDFVELLKKTAPDFVVMERFMVRNRGQSVLAEIINQMLGRISVLTKVFISVETHQFTAAQWKNWWNKQKKEDWCTLYPELDSIHKKDAAGMAQYADDYWIDKHIVG